MGSLEGKIGLVSGVANCHSIAWAVAQAWHDEGATLVFTYHNERHYRNVQALVDSLSSDSMLLHCDLAKDEDVDIVRRAIADKHNRLDLLLHSVAYAPPEALKESFIQTGKEGFLKTLEMSVYSMLALTRHATPLMSQGGSVLAISYYGAKKVIPNYNIMGVAKAALESTVRYLAYDLGSQNIRVNGISPGPVDTLAARGVRGFKSIQEKYEKIAPLRRNVVANEIGKTAVFLASDAASAITGQIIYTDCGYSVMGL
ncbi:MAG: enoyl-ACP reductase [Dehalococcoidia bacterium]|nr:enoyl-ACP reductase [Dehalococcoidia bacterium]